MFSHHLGIIKGANLTSRFVSPLVHESENADSGYTANLSLSLSSFVFFSPRAGKPISTRHPLSSYHLDFPLPQLVPSHFSLGFCLPWNNPVFGDNAYGDSSWRANYTIARGSYYVFSLSYQFLFPYFLSLFLFFSRNFSTRRNKDSISMNSESTR